MPNAPIPAPSEPSPGNQPGPLSTRHIEELLAARKRSTKVRRAAGVAAMSGWSMAIFAAITVLGGLFGDVASVLLGVGLAAVAYNEIRGGKMLKGFDPRGASVLGYNQLALGALIVLYAGWAMFASLRNPILSVVGGSTGDPQMDATIGNLSKMVSFGLYGGMAVLGIIVPGLTSWYYFTRASLVQTVAAQTPPWVIEAMRAAA